jgi:predicted RNA binding protein YcfA (HicA-like mRNA interferase family)
VKVLERVGYYCKRQRGSHIRLYHAERTSVTIPNHYEVDRTTLRKILEIVGISGEEFLGLL